MTLLQRQAYFTIVAKVLIADGVLTDQERVYLDQVAQRVELSVEEQQSVLLTLDADGDIKDALSILEPSMRRQLADHLRDAALADGKVVAVENEMLAIVRASLGDC